MQIKKITLIFALNFSMILAQGSLLLVGGGGENYNDWSDIPYAWLVVQADSGIVINIDVSSTASWYTSYFESFGADPASQGLQISSRSMANDPAIAELLRTASGIFIEGGDQWPYVETWDGTLAEQAIIDVFNAGGVIGGTSAGLAVLGEVDFTAQYGGILAPDALSNPCQLDMALSDALLPLLPGVITDSHFHSRGRLGRLIPMLARWQHETGTWLTGLGIADNTAACVDAQGIMTVWGEGSVSVLYPEPDITSNVNCNASQTLELTSMRMDQLTHGAVYDLRNKLLLDGAGTILPVTPTGPVSGYQVLTLDGSSDATSDLGAFRVTNLTTNLAAWQGNLGLVVGSGNLPGTVIMPRIWHEYDEYENRLVGTLWAMGQHPGLTGLFLDSDASAVVNAEGMLTPTGQVWVFDSHLLTHAGFPDDHNTCYGGFMGMRVHILNTGIAYDLTTQHLVSIDAAPRVPAELNLKAWPNPFNPDIRIQYQLREAGHVSLVITDVRGRIVASLEDGHHEAGSFIAFWGDVAQDGKDLGSGIYFCVLCTPAGNECIKLVNMK